MLSFRKPGKPQSLRPVHLPAPVQGLNTIDPAGEMPGKFALILWNLVAAEYGLRTRLGLQEWCTGLAGNTDTTVRTTMAFVGSQGDASTDKLFGVTQKGIYDCTATSASPTLLVTFGTQTGNAGYGVFHMASTAAGRFLLYCDEENGLYVYTEGGAWAKVALGTNQLWTSSTTYAVGNKTVNGGKVYVVTAITTGISASSGGPTGTGTGIVDGGVTWDYVSAFVGSTIGPSLADQQAGFTADPAGFAFVAIWKSRVWFVEKNSARAWYLSVNAIFGVATSFNFGQKMRAGGPLVGLYDWSYDGGSGLDDLLVGISTAGDIVIYQGTDPASAATFGLKGVWSVAGVPSGRRIATNYGGDVLVMSLLGLIPLSKLITGASIFDRAQYATKSIDNLFNFLVQNAASMKGWSVFAHPQDNTLMVTVPQQDGQPTQQLAMSFTTGGWSRYRDLPMLSAGIWKGKLYFGTADGRLCLNDGYVDGVTLAAPTVFTPVNWSLLGAYQGGDGQQKAVRMIRTDLLSQTPNPIVQATAKYDYDLTEPPPPVGAAGGGAANSWDSAKWDFDTAIWAGDYTPSSVLQGATGMGRAVAIAARGAAISRTVVVGFQVFYEQGGLR